MAEWLNAEARKGGVDILHNHGFWMMPNVYPGRTARKFSLPYIVSPHGTLSSWAMNSGSKVKRLFWPLVQKPSLKTVTCFHATAEHEYHDIRRAGFRQPVAIIPNGVDIPAAVVKPSSNMRTLLFLGRIHPVKGLDMLLPAWGAIQARFPDWKLRIIGPDDGGYLSRVHALASDLRLKRIDFCSPVFGSDKWHAYAEADLFILPSYSENFGMTVAEALAAGTPAIVTHGAPWQGLNEQEAGWWINTGIDPIVECLETALTQSPEALQKKGQRGRDWMARDFSWQHVGEKMTQTYQWMLHGGALPGWIIED